MSELEWSFGVLPSESERPVRRSLSDSFKLQPGQQVGSYRLLEQLGRGAMGVVYLAEDQRFRRRVALKFLLETRLDGRALERFRREGTVLASLRHPGIVAVHDQGELNGRPFLVMELVEGARGFDEALPSMTRRAAVEAVLQAARALGHAHQRGVVHRDIKPGNLLLDPNGNLVVSDFGLAALTSDATQRLTQSGALVGTPAHMAPEQIESKRHAISPASDVWALGTVLYQALTQRAPFDGAETLPELMFNIASSSFPRPRKVDPTISPALEAVVLKALQADPARRFPDGEAMAVALERALLEPARAPTRRLLPRLLLGAVVVAAIAAGWLLGAPADLEPQPEASAQDSAAARWYAEARALEERDDHVGALAALEHALQADPAHAPSYSLRGAMLRELERFDEARQAAARALDLDPQLVEGWQLEAALSFDAGELEQALAHAERALELDPDQADTLGLLTEVHRQRGHLDEALRCGRRAYELDPDDPVVCNNLGLVLLMQEELDEAETYLRRAAELDPKAESPWNNLAWLLYQRGDVPGAIEVVSRGLSHCASPNLYRLRGELRTVGKDYEGALGDLDRAVAESPRDIRNREARVTILEKLGRKSAAIADLVAILDAEPEDPQVWGKTAVGLQELGAFPQARRALRGALQRDERFGWWNQLGMIEAELNDPTAAEIAYARAIELAPQEAVPYMNRALLYMDLDHLKAARLDLRQAEQLDDGQYAEQIRELLSQVEARRAR